MIAVACKGKQKIVDVTGNKFVYDYLDWTIRFSRSKLHIAFLANDISQVYQMLNIRKIL